MGLRDIGATLPPGFRFYPSDEELVCHYLYKKIANEDVLKGTLVEIDLHTCEPWQLPEVAKLNSSEWYFFSFRDRKYATGFRTNRATISGYWKATGKDRIVIDPRTRAIVGMRKTLVFYKNRAPNGIKTGWIMHEFRLENPHIPPKEDWVLCRVFHKAKGENSSTNKHSPQNMYEAPDVITSPDWAVSPPIMNHNYGIYRPNSGGFTQSPDHQIQKSSPAHNHLLDLSLPAHHQSYLQLAQDMMGAPVDDMAAQPKCVEDEYGFLLDMNLEDGGVIRFDDENSLVFI